jgi:hypothetical protein
LVRDQAQVRSPVGKLCRDSLASRLENSEFLAADNRNGNQFDGFNWHKHMWPKTRGRYVIFCHEDVELVDCGY